MLESKIERDFKKYCDSKGVMCLKMIAAGDSGMPDRTMYGPGFTYMIEFKRPQHYPSPLQKHMHDKLRKLGHVVLCFNTEGAAEDSLDTFLSRGTPTYTTDEKGITELHGIRC